MRYNAPQEETRYLIDIDRVDRDRYEKIARDIARAVLLSHPRETAEVVVDAAAPVIRAQNDATQAAFERLLEAGLTVPERTLFGFTLAQGTDLGRVTASPVVLEDIFTVLPYCYKLEFRDEDGKLLVRFAEWEYGCFFWLPSSRLEDVIARLDEEPASLVLSFDSWIDRQESNES